MRKYPDRYFDLGCVDPNFGIGESSKNHASRNTPIVQKNGSILRAPKQKFERSSWDDKQPVQAYFNQLCRVCKKVIIMGDNYLQFEQKRASSGRIVWDKCNGGSDFSDCEIFWTNCHSSVRLVVYMWNGMFQGESLTNPRKQQGNKQLNEVRITPAHKPIHLYRWLFREYAKVGDKILDTHLGGGSSRIAAYDMGIDFVGYENNKLTFQRQQKRFEQYTIAPQLFRGY